MTQKEKIFLFLIIFLVYLNSIVNPFIFDDIALVVNNGFIKNFKFLKYYFTSNLFKCAGEEDLFYRPFQTLFYAIVYKISKGNTFGYHLLNILLHSGCAVLIYLLLTKLYDKKTSFLVSLLWGIHPINTEAITYISGTADPLFLFFGLLGIYLYNLSYSSSKKKHLFLILSCISFIFSLLSKETSVLILPLFFLYLYSTGNLKKEKKSDYIIITSIFLIYLILRKTVLNFGKTEPEEIFLYRFFTSFKAFLVYISILIFPFILSMERHLPYIKTPKDIDFISGLFLFILFLYFLWKKRNDKKILFAGLLFLLNFIFHSNTIIPLNGNLREHWMYVGAIGFFIYFVMLIEKIKKEKIKIALIILIFSLYGVRTILRNYDWLDPISFYEKSLKYFPYSKKLIHNYGVELLMKYKYEKALIQFKKLEKQFANSKRELSKATLGISKSYFMLGNYEEAMKYYIKTLEIDPFNFDALTGLGLIYERKGDTENCLNFLNKAVQINPYSSPTLYLLGKIYLDKGNYDLAEKIFIKAIELDPKESIYWNKLGICYFKEGQFDKSLYCFLNAYKFNKNDFLIILNLARACQRLNKHNEAIFYFERVFELEPEKTKKNIEILNDYAISLNEIGEKEKSIEILKKILKIKPDFEPAKINLRIILQQKK